MMLEVAELAYPHWVALVGAEPPDPDTRMYFVYANDGNQMIEAMKSDVGMGTAGGFGGGITIYDNHSAYNYPSGTLLYHQRALVIHENLHMLQMVVHGIGRFRGFHLQRRTTRLRSGKEAAHRDVPRQGADQQLDGRRIGGPAEGLHPHAEGRRCAVGRRRRPRASFTSSSCGAIPTAG